MSEIDFEIVKTGNGYANDLAATAAKYANDTNKAVQELETSTQEVKKEIQRLTKATVALDEKTNYYKSW